MANGVAESNTGSGETSATIYGTVSALGLSPQQEETGPDSRKERDHEQWRRTEPQLTTFLATSRMKNSLTDTLTPLLLII